MDFDILVELKLREQAAAPLDAQVPAQLHQCGSCGRQFAAATLERHRAVCAKVFVSKRPPMDMTQQRLSGVERAAAAVCEGVSYGRAGKSKGGARGSRGAAVNHLDERPAAASGARGGGKWKRQSEQLRAAMKGSRCDDMVKCEL
jgi:hypothetical protein